MGAPPPPPGGPLTVVDDEARHLDGVARLTRSLASAGLVVDDELRLDLVGPHSTTRVSRLVFEVDDEPPVVGFATVSTDAGGDPVIATTSLWTVSLSSSSRRSRRSEFALDPPTVHGDLVAVPASGSTRAAYEGATNAEVVRCRELHGSLDRPALAALTAYVEAVDHLGLHSVSALVTALVRGEDDSLTSYSVPEVASRVEVLSAATLIEGAAAGAPVEWVLRRLETGDAS